MQFLYLSRGKIVALFQKEMFSDWERSSHTRLSTTGGPFHLIAPL
jgi:hypothetical protein